MGRPGWWPRTTRRWLPACARRATRTADLSSKLKVSVELEKQQRAANLLAGLRADCERMQMPFSISIIVADEETVALAKCEVRWCFVTFMAELIMAEIAFYAEFMHGRNLLESYQDVLVVFAAGVHATDKAPGEGDVLAATADRKRARKAMSNVLGAEAASTFESIAQAAPDEQNRGAEDVGDTYYSQRIADFLDAFDDTREDCDSAPPPPSDNVAALQTKRLYSVMLSFGETNVDRIFRLVYHGLRRLLRRGLENEACDVLGVSLGKKELLEAESLIAQYHILFRRDVQSKFRAVVKFLSCDDDSGGGEGGRQWKAFVEAAPGKRRKLEDPVLISAADDALRKAGVAAGLRAGPEDERRVLLFQSSKGVAARADNGHKLPDWDGEADGARAAKVAKASDDVAAICDSALGKRLDIGHANHPNVRFLALVNGCMKPLLARWECVLIHNAPLR